MFARRRMLNVSIAVVFEPEWGFFLSYNPRWHGYAFPMRKFRSTDVDFAYGALEALREATNLPLRGATVQPLASLQVEGESQRTGQATMMYSEIVPPEGGETEFADMYAAYDKLSSEMKQRIEGKRAIHNLDFSRTRRHPPQRGICLTT